jgi:hypothetical protein
LVDMDDLEEDYDFLEVLHVALEYKKPPEFNIGSLNGLLLSEHRISVKYLSPYSCHKCV